MIKLTNRNEIKKSKKIISSELSKLQKAFYDDETFEEYKEDNEEHIYLEMYDFLNHDLSEYKTFNTIIGINHCNINTFTAELSSKVKELLNAINASEFILISHLKLDFFGNRKNKFKPLVNAYKNLEKIVGQKSYEEAFIFDLESLPEIIEMLFWITRCDPSAPEYLFLFDNEQKIQISLCKYGNIHLTQFDKEVLTEKKLSTLGWAIIEEESDNFTEDGAIDGRQMKME
jgi:hypothetical protein